MESGAYTDRQAEELTDMAWEVLGELAEDQARCLGDASPVDHYLGILDTLLTQRKIFLAPIGTEETPPAGSELVGWISDLTPLEH